VINGETGLQVLARWISRHAGLVTGVSLVMLVPIGGAWATSHGTSVDMLDLPGAESQSAVDLLKEHVPSRAGDQATVVVHAERTLRDPELQVDVREMQAIAEDIPGVVGVVPPYAPASGAIPDDGKAGIMVVQFAQIADEVAEASVDALHEMRESYDSADLQVELGGVVITAGEEAPRARPR
jgi:RND superfamily putative drug exporter